MAWGGRGCTIQGELLEEHGEVRGEWREGQILSWGECQLKGGTQDTCLYSKANKGPGEEVRQLGPQHKAGVWESAEVSGEDAAATAWTCPYLPGEGGCQADFPECQAASFRPTPARGKGDVLGNRNTWDLGRVETGRKRSVEGVVGLESHNCLGGGRRTGIPGFWRQVRVG